MNTNLLKLLIVMLLSCMALSACSPKEEAPPVIDGGGETEQVDTLPNQDGGDQASDADKQNGDADEQAGEADEQAGEADEQEVDSGKQESDQAQPDSEMAIDNSGTYVSMLYQEQSGDGALKSYFELPLIKYDGSQAAFDQYDGLNPNLRLIENEINGRFGSLYHEHWNEGGENDNIFVVTYPFDDGDVIQLVITSYVTIDAKYPLVDVASYHFTRSTNELLSLDDMLAADGYTKDYIELLATEFMSDGSYSVVSASVNGFLQNGSETEYFVSLTLSDGTEQFDGLFVVMPDSDAVSYMELRGQYQIGSAENLMELDPPLHYSELD